MILSGGIFVIYVYISTYLQFREVQGGYEPLYFALAKSFRRGHGNGNQIENDQSQSESSSESSSENSEQPIKYVYQPLIVVLANTIRQAAIDNGSNMTELLNELLFDEKLLGDESLNLLTLPFKILQKYGLSDASNFMPQLSSLQNYKSYYDKMMDISSLGQSTAEHIGSNVDQIKGIYDSINNFWGAKEIKSSTERAAEEAEDEGQVREEFMKEPSVEGRAPTYATFEKYYPYAKHAINIGTYFVPGLSQYKQVMFGLEVMRVAWKTAEMYKNGESWMSMTMNLGREAFSLGKRDELETVKNKLEQNSFIDISKMDTNIFLELINRLEYVSLQERKENEIRDDIVNVINSYFTDELQEEEKEILIEVLKRTVKFIALHAIAPAI